MRVRSDSLMISWCRERNENQVDKIRLGEEYQAKLPACRSKPRSDSQPTRNEASWLQHFVMRAGNFGAANQAVPIVLMQDRHHR